MALLWSALITLSTLAPHVSAQDIPNTDMASAVVALQTRVTGVLKSFPTVFAASVVSADPCDTTLALRCLYTNQAMCSNVSGVDMTVVLNERSFRVAYSTNAADGMAAYTEDCSISLREANASYFCTAAATVSAFAMEYSTTTKTNLSASEMTTAQIPVTAGAEKLPSAGVTCTQQNSGALLGHRTEVFLITLAVAGVLNMMV